LARNGSYRVHDLILYKERELSASCFKGRGYLRIKLARGVLKVQLSWAEARSEGSLGGGEGGSCGCLLISVGECNVERGEKT